MDADPMSDDVIGEATISFNELCVNGLDRQFDIKSSGEVVGQIHFEAVWKPTEKDSDSETLQTEHEELANLITESNEKDVKESQMLANLITESNDKDVQESDIFNEIVQDDVTEELTEPLILFNEEATVNISTVQEPENLIEQE